MLILHRWLEKAGSWHIVFLDGRKLLNIQQRCDDDEDVIHGGNSTTSIFHATNWMLCFSARGDNLS